MNNIQLKRHLLKSRDSLEGFTLKNKSIFFKANDKSTINLSFEESMGNAHQPSDLSSGQILRWSSKEFDLLFNSQKLDLDVYLSIDDNEFQSNSNLHQKLKYFNYISDNFEKEYDSPCLYLLGPFLSWKSQFNVTNAPIFKIPIYLKRSKENKFYLKFQKKTFVINEILVHYLDHFFNINLEKDKEFSSANYALHYLVENLTIHNIDVQFLKYKYDISSQEDNNLNQFLIYDFMFIDNMETDNLSLYKDYNYIIKNIEQPNLVTNLLSDSLKNDNYNEELQIEKFNLFPYKYDSYLQNLIEQLALKDSVKALFPTGVENYSSILNIIIKNIIEEKSVLFVSENNKIFDYIYSELISHGFFNKIAKFPNHTSNKSEIYDSIFEFKNFEKIDFDRNEFKNNLYNTKQVKFEINEYIKILQEKHLKSGLTNLEIIHKTFFANKDLYDSNIYHKFGFIEWDKISSILEEINGIQYFYNRLNNNLDSPWRYKLEITLKNKLLFDDLVNIKTSIHNLKGKKNYLQYKISQFVIQNDLTEYLEPYSLFMNRNFSKLDISYDYRNLWENHFNFLTDLPDISNSLQCILIEMEDHKLGYQSIKEGTAPKVVNDLAIFFKVQNKFSKYFTKSYWVNRSLVKKICPNWDGKVEIFDDYLKYIECFEKLIHLVSRIRCNIYLENNNHEYLMDYVYKIQKDLESISELFKDIEKTFTAKHYQEAIQSFYSYKSLIQFVKDLSDTINQIEEFDKTIQIEWNKLSNFIQLDKVHLNTIEKKISFINIMIDRIDDIDFIHQYNKIICNLQDKYSLINLDIDIIECLSHHKLKWKDIVYSSVVLGWFGDLISYNPSLKNYGRELIRSLFSDLNENNEYVKFNLNCYFRSTNNEKFENIKNHKIYQNLLNKLLDDSNPKLLVDESHLFLKMKPCWLLNTKEVSKILPLESELFDLVIIDDHADLNIDKILPSIYRSKKLLTIKNNNNVLNYVDVYDKMKENSHFNKDLNYYIEKQSSTTMFKFVNGEFNESLLSFANHAFYSGELKIAPSPFQFLSNNEVEYFDLNYTQVTSAKSENYFETDFVIERLLKEVELYPLKSYAIITTSLEQALHYKEALNSKIKKSGKLEWIASRLYGFGEFDLETKIVIKDIKNIGSEKFDTILFSTGSCFTQNKIDYAEILKIYRDHDSKILINNLISSVKNKFILINTIPLYLMETNDKFYAENYNLCILGRFLKFIKSLSEKNYEKSLNMIKQFKSKNLSENLKPSEFSQFVKTKLMDCGYKVSEMVGYNNIYIDLAIQNPYKENYFVLGIECDECILHSSQHFSDKIEMRDKKLIENGWNIEKIYSIDWLKNPDEEIHRLNQLIKNLIQINMETIDTPSITDFHVEETQFKFDAGRFQLKMGVL